MEKIITNTPCKTLFLIKQIGKHFDFNYKNSFFAILLAFMQNKIFVFVFVLLTAFYTNGSAQNLGIHPTTLYFNLGAGQSETQVIHISNGSDKKVQYRVYLNDWIRDSTGGHEYYRPDSISRSCARWITINKNFVELQPKEAVDLTVKMQLPDSAKAAAEMKWAMLFIETVEEQVNAGSKQAQATVRNLLRLGVHVYQTPPTLTNKEVRILDVKANDSMQNSYYIICKNTGDIMLDCKAYIEVTSVADGKKTKLDAVEYPIFPGQKRYVLFELPKNLPKGKYSALAVIDAGEDMSLEAIESTIEVKEFKKN